MELTLKKNIKTIYWMFFFQSFMIVIAVFVPLLQRHGLSMSQVLQTQALFAFVVATFEVPSGYLADLWGRKNTIIIGFGTDLILARFGRRLFPWDRAQDRR
jgi:MFS family permease